MIDYAYACWLLAVNDQRTLAAMVYSALCPLLGSLSLFILLDHWFTLLPSALGHAFGTFIAMRWDGRVKEAESWMNMLDTLPDDIDDRSDIGDTE